MSLSVGFPSKNKIHQGFSSSHKGYDFDDVPVKEYFASFDGVIEKVVNSFTRSWIANLKNSDPYYPGDNKPKRALRTEDYGNFLILRGNNGYKQLAAHFPKDKIIVKVGQTVKKGQVLGFAPGNADDTGNSTGGHTHTEYRNSSNICVSVTFTATEDLEPDKDTMEVVALLKKYSTSSLDELDKKIDEHVGTTWGAEDKAGGGYLANDRRKVTGLGKTIDTLTKKVSEMEEERKSLVTKDYMDRKLKETESSALTEFNDMVTKKNTRIKELEDAISTLQTQAPKGWQELIQRYTSRKFVLAVLALLLPLINQWLSLGLTQEQILTGLAPVMLFIGAEGWKDIRNQTT